MTIYARLQKIPDTVALLNLQYLFGKLLATKNKPGETSVLKLEKKTPLKTVYIYILLFKNKIISIDDTVQPTLKTIELCSTHLSYPLCQLHLNDEI